MTALFISDDQAKNVMTAVSAMLKKNLGVDFAPKNLERGVYYDALDALNYDVARSSFTAKYLDAKSFLDKFTSDNTFNNLTGYKNPAFDALVTQAQTATDAKARGLWTGRFLRRNAAPRGGARTDPLLHRKRRWR